MRRAIGRWISGTVLVALFGWGAITSVRLAQADYWSRQETVNGTERALSLGPDQAEYHVRLAKLLADSDPPRARAALSRAVTINPWDSESWIALGLSYEAAGDNSSAERCLLYAADVDQQYLPRWSLTNFYFRRGDTARFWKWAKSSSEMVYGDPVSLFRLCGMISEDGRLIERLAIRKPDLRAAYLSYLLTDGKLPLIGPSTRDVLETHRQVDVPVLLTACDRLLEQNHIAESLAIWNALAAAHSIGYEPLDPQHGHILTNTELEIAPESHGFDWRVAGLEGVTASREESPSGLRLSFSGRQPESCEPLVQFLPVEGDTSYKVEFRYRTDSASTDSGLRWRATDAGGALLAETGPLSSSDPAEGSLIFRTPRGSLLVRLTLAYRRMPGTVRLEGFISLYHVSVSPTAGTANGAPRQGRSESFPRRRSKWDHSLLGQTLSTFGGGWSGALRRR